MSGKKHIKFRFSSIFDYWTFPYALTKHIAMNGMLLKGDHNEYVDNHGKVTLFTGIYVQRYIFQKVTNGTCIT